MDKTIENDIILEVKDLNVTFRMNEGDLNALTGIDLEIYRGKTLGIVGESGCGKSVTANAIMRLLPRYTQIEGNILLHNKKGELLNGIFVEVVLNIRIYHLRLFAQQL